jgi:mannose-1-phosphate guanylyltransferase
MDKFWAVIPAGGAGTRLWPLSRASRPKFLLPLVSDRTLLQQTSDRLTPLATNRRTLVVAGPAHAAEIARQLPAIPSDHLIIEPVPRGTGPAIGLAAMLISLESPRAIMGSFAADHAILDTAAFDAAIRAAIKAATQDWLVTIGLTPTRPETGYGYIARTDQLVTEDTNGSAYRSTSFIEKPDAETADAFFTSGHHLWNASMFIWRVSTFLQELERLQPELYAGLKTIGEAWHTPERDQAMADIWPGLPSVTIDQGIMEHAARVAVVPAEMGWSDVGDWHGLGELITQDALGNSVKGDFLQVDCHHSVVWSETGRLVALVGVENLAVVDTPDALLVVDREHAQDVKRIVEQLKQRNDDLS